MTKRTLTILIVLTGLATQLAAQVPSMISVQLYLEENGIPVTGTRLLDIAWHTSAVGGLPEHREQLSADVIDGIATVYLGSTVPLPPDLLLKGPFWLAIQIDGGVELQPRTMLASVPYAMMADRSRVAQALAPEVTGVVTSVNEIAGAVQLVGGSGLDITRTGTTLRIDHRHVNESGRIEDRPGEHAFSITPLATLLPDHTIGVRVLSDTHIAVNITGVDYATNTIYIETSAPLLATELILWTIH